MDGGQIGILADIGRQSVRFALSGGMPGTAPRDVRSYNTADYTTFTSALQAYLGEIGAGEQPLPGVLAVAGSVRSDLVNLTGSRWYISLAGVESVLRQRPKALNECAAAALALGTLPLSEFTSIGNQTVRPPRPGGAYVTIAIGTGLGVAALITTPDGRLCPVQTEAGHMAFNPSTDEEQKFARYIQSRTRGPISAEALLSAKGLVDAYAALSDGTKSAESPEQVTRTADRDAAATAAVRMFSGYLGAFIGDLVLAYGAWDGAFVTGPIARDLRVKLGDGRLRQRLEAKDAFRRQLSDLPVSVVGRTDLVLLGAAAALQSLTASG